MQFLVLVITGSVYVKMVNKKGCKVEGLGFRVRFGGFKFRLWGLRFGGFGFDKDPPPGEGV